MKKIVLSLSAIAMLAMFTTSCSKSSSSSSTPTEAQLVGTWKLSKLAVDANGNGKMDANEEIDPSVFGTAETYKINSDKTGFDYATDLSSNVTDTTAFSWSLSGSNFTMVESGVSQTAHIDAFSTSSITLKSYDSTGGKVEAQWGIFQKQ